MPRPSFVLQAAVVIISILAHPREGGAVLLWDIDLMADGRVPGWSQTSGRWGSFPVGPYAVAGDIDAQGGPVNIARCGCHLTSLAAALEGIVGASQPWFFHEQYLLNAQEGATGATRSVLEMSPKYLDDFFNHGPDPSNPRVTGWGFVPGSGGSNCGTGTYPWASTWAVSNVGVPWPSGVTWTRTTWSWLSRQLVDGRLADGIPTLIYRTQEVDPANPVPSTGLHANLIVGWDNTAGKYLVYDPMWNYSALDLDPEPRIASYGAGTDDERHANYLNAIRDVFLLEPVSGPSIWMFLRDDPEPIVFRITDPRGRRTGYDPETGENLQEDQNAFFSESTSFADPLGLFEDAPVFRYFAARDPEPGAYARL